jgi:NADPH-dependent curcumin reductase CurA
MDGVVSRAGGNERVRFWLFIELDNIIKMKKQNIKYKLQTYKFSHLGVFS